MSSAESILRWSGGLLAYATLAVVLYGIWRGTKRPAGRTSGSASCPARFMRAGHLHRTAFGAVQVLRTGGTTPPGWLRSALFYLLATACFLALSAWFWKPLPLTLSPAGRSICLAAGALVYFPGVALVLWGRLRLGRMYFVSTGFGAQLYADHQLVTGGPFAFVRHPMYLGLVAAGLGSFLLYQTWTALAYAVFAPFVLRRARREEQALAAEFGEAWQEYSRRVPAFLPRFHLKGKKNGKIQDR